MGRWNLELGDVDPQLSLLDGAEETVLVRMPRFDTPDGAAADLPRGVPVRRIDGHLVTTVFDLLLAQYGVGRDGLPGEWPQGYDDADSPYTPAWQEAITGVPASTAARIGREFAANAEESRGRSMIVMGAGTNHWFHSDTIYRAFLTLTNLTGCQGVNGGGWAHYVGQEKVRPITGYTQIANALDWNRPPRNMIQTAFWYLHTNQFRYDQFGADTLSATTGKGQLAGKSTADVIAQSARMGWMPSYPTFDRNPLTISDDAAAAGKPVAEYVVEQLKAGELDFAGEDPDAPQNYPRILSIWRANLLGSSGKGNEYFLKHLLGTDSSIRATETPEGQRPVDVTWRDEAPEGKLDLLMTIDFRQTSTTIFSDVVLPAATWYEKHDLNTTDMHPFVHSFNPAIAPPWQTRTDWDAWQTIAAKFSELAATHLGVRKDVVAVPLTHDTADAMANPHGVVRDWKKGECEPIPGVTMPKLVEVERDYGAVAEKMNALGPLVDTLGATTKGVTFELGKQVDYLRRKNGPVRGGVADGRPSLKRDVDVCEAILALSGTTNGALATQGFKTLEKRTGVRLADLAEEHEGKQITFADTQGPPVPVITSPEWSGSETGGRRYSPFTINVERKKPWHTLTGRMHFYLDHDWMTELGEGLPVYRPPLNMAALFAEPALGNVSDGSPGQGVEGLTVRYLTPHNKWSIHSEYQDNLFMLSLSRGGQNIWMSDRDAAKVGIEDNDWIEAVNRNGVVVARAIVSHRMPEGTVYMYHAQDRLIDVPIAETSGKRGGIHNSLTRLLVKPSHLIGGYAQLTFAFNYLGPTGNQRDEVTIIRKRGGDDRHVSSRGDSNHRTGDGPDGDGDEPRQVHRLPHLLGDLQAGVDQPVRHGVHLVQQRRDPARARLPAHVRGPGEVAGRLEARQAGPARPQGRRALQEAADDLLQPQAALDRRVLRAVDLRLRHADRRAGAGAHPGGAAEVADLGPEHEDRVVGELGRRPRRLHQERAPRPDAREDRREGEVRVRADLHVLPAAHLRALPEPVVRRLLPERGDLQARGGRHRPRRPGPLPRLADVRLGLSLQEDLLQPPHRQGREVHLLLPAHRGGPADRLLRDVRRPAALHRPDALRRRPGAGGRVDDRRAGPLRGPARRLPRPVRPDGDPRGGEGRDRP